MLISGNVLSRPEQVPDLATISTSTGGIWACTIRFHDGMFFVITTLVKDQEPQDSLARWQNVPPFVIRRDLFVNAYPSGHFHQQGHLGEQRQWLV